MSNTRQPRFLQLQQWLDWFEQEHPEKIDRGLKRIQQVASQLGLLHPKSFTITVAGTNGKGSSISLLESLFDQAGIHTGSYTSPHLHQYNERIRINGQPVSDDEIIDAFDCIERARGSIELSYFEYSTLAALEICRNEDVDVMLLEVGLGGRLDAVNIIDADIALVTNISIDHTHWLGNTVDEIAPEKAAIARKNRPVVVADGCSPAALLLSLERIGAEIHIADKDYSYKTAATSWSWRSSSIHLQNLPYSQVSGRHQRTNAAAVLMVLQLLPEKLRPGLKSIKQGLQQFTIAGRQELFEMSGTKILFDVAHNQQSAVELNNKLTSLQVTGDILCVFGMMQDKNIEQFVTIIQDKINHWFVSSANTDRAIGATDLANMIRPLAGKANVSKSESLDGAWRCAQRRASASDLIVVTGSFYTVAVVRQLLIETDQISA